MCFALAMAGLLSTGAAAWTVNRGPSALIASLIILRRNFVSQRQTAREVARGAPVKRRPPANPTLVPLEMQQQLAGTQQRSTLLDGAAAARRRALLPSTAPRRRSAARRRCTAASATNPDWEFLRRSADSMKQKMEEFARQQRLQDRLQEAQRAAAQAAQQAADEAQKRARQVGVSRAAAQGAVSRRHAE